MDAILTKTHYLHEILGGESEFKICYIKKLERSEKIWKQNGYFRNWAIKFQLCFYGCNFDETRYLQAFLGYYTKFQLSHLKKLECSKKIHFLWGGKV